MVFHGVEVKKQFKRMRELAPEAYRVFLEFDGKAFAEGAMPVKTKELIALGIAQITQCPWCIDAHTARATKAGAVCASMHHGHWVICAMPSAISSFVLTGIAPSANALPSNSRNTRYASGASSRIRLNCFLTSTPWNTMAALLSWNGRPLFTLPRERLQPVRARPYSCAP